MSGPDSPGFDASAVCRDVLRAGDRDRYLASLLGPDDARHSLWALGAFTIEISRIRASVREPGLGEIRLQWWQDAIDGIFHGHVSAAPVIQALAHTIKTASLPHAPFTNMIEAHRFDLYDDPMPTLHDLEGYLGETTSATLQLGVLCSGGPTDASRFTEVSGLGGVAAGLVRILCTLPQTRARGQCFIPLDLLARCGLTPAHLLAGRNVQALEPVLAEMRTLARARLDAARVALKGLSHKPASAVFLPLVMTELYLQKLDRMGTGALAQNPVTSDLRRLTRLSWAHWFGRI